MLVLPLLNLFLFFLFSPSLVLSLPTLNSTQDGVQLSKRAAPPWAYRILPLGASIVYGVGSEASGGNGFRKYLRDTLRQSNYKVNMVGSLQCGHMMDNSCEATSGFTVDQVHEAAKRSTKYQPNIILINAGTNDARLHIDIHQIGERMDRLLDTLFEQCPGTTILLSTVIVSNVGHIDSERVRINAQYQSLAHRRRHQLGQKIVLVNMDRAGRGWSGVQPRHLDADGIHPNVDGFALMAEAFKLGIEEAEEAGFITEPKPSDFTNDDVDVVDNTCPKRYGVSRGPINTMTGQGGAEDGLYTHSTSGSHQFAHLTSTSAEDPFVFAKIDPDSDQSYIIQVTNETDVSNGWRKHFVYVPGVNSDGQPWYHPYPRTFYTQDACIKRGIRWADINADGMDDMLCIGPDGTVYATVNHGIFDWDSGNLSTVYRGVWKQSEGFPQSRVRIADIDGDGRADYCVVHNNGDVECWRNGGTGNMPAFFQPLGIVFTGKGLGDVDGVRFFDINGDGRDDWLWMNDAGQTHTYTNSRGCTKGVDGQHGLKPNWRAASSNPTHAGMGTAGARNQISFARIYNSPAAFGLRARGDYVRVVRQSQLSDIYTYNFFAWRNTGAGAAKPKGDGTRFCNMMGHANGAQDLVWILSTGRIRIYRSKGGSFGDPPYWGANSVIWEPTENLDRRDIHLADWDGDGQCDIIHVDPEDTTRISVWLNRYQQNGNNFNSWDFIANAGPSEGTGVRCPRRGPGHENLGTRFADISGNGMADMLCLEPDGRVFGYINTNAGNTWTFHPQLKRSEGKDRANLRFADVNGDGRADLLWIDKFSGDTSVWQNRGPIPASGSSWTWDAKGKLFQGALAGACLMYPDLDGNGRADMTAVDAVSNEAQTWFNDCGDRGGDDPNTHVARSVLPAPPVDDLVSTFLAARWNGRVDDLTVPWDDYEPEYMDLSQVFAFHDSCNSDHRQKIMEAWLQVSSLVDFINYRIMYGEINWEHPWAMDFFGPPGLTTPNRQRILDVLSNMSKFTRGPRSEPIPGPMNKMRFTCDVPRCSFYGAPCFAGNAGQEEGWKESEAKTPGQGPGHVYWPGQSSITVCEGFLYPNANGRAIQPMHRALHRISNNIDDFKNLGTALFHEMLHLWEVSLVGTNALPAAQWDIRDVQMYFGVNDNATAYGGLGARTLARFSEQAQTMYGHRNADSYMLYVLGWFIKERNQDNGLRYPDLPAVGRVPSRLLNAKRRRNTNNTTAADYDVDAPLYLSGIGALYPDNHLEPESKPATASAFRMGAQSSSDAVQPSDHRLYHDSAFEVPPVHIRFENANTRDMYPSEYVAHLDALFPDQPIAAIRRGSSGNGTAAGWSGGGGNDTSVRRTV